MAANVPQIKDAKTGQMRPMTMQDLMVGSGSNGGPTIQQLAQQQGFNHPKPTGNPMDMLVNNLPSIGGIVGGIGGEIVDPLGGGVLGGGAGGALGQALKDMIQKKSLDPTEIAKQGGINALFGLIPGGEEALGVGKGAEDLGAKALSEGAVNDVARNVASKVPQEEGTNPLLQKIKSLGTDTVKRGIVGGGVGGTQALIQDLGQHKSNQEMLSDTLSGALNVGLMNSIALPFAGKVAKSLGEGIPDMVSNSLFNYSDKVIASTKSDIENEVEKSNYKVQNLQSKMDEAKKSAQNDISNLQRDAQAAQSEGKFNQADYESKVAEAQRKHQENINNIEQQIQKAKEDSQNNINKIADKYNKAKLDMEANKKNAIANMFSGHSDIQQSARDNGILTPEIERDMGLNENTANEALSKVEEKMMEHGKTISENTKGVMYDNPEDVKQQIYNALEDQGLTDNKQIMADFEKYFGGNDSTQGIPKEYMEAIKRSAQKGYKGTLIGGNTIDAGASEVKGDLGKLQEYKGTFDRYFGKGTKNGAERNAGKAIRSTIKDIIEQKAPEGSKLAEANKQYHNLSIVKGNLQKLLEGSKPAESESALQSLSATLDSLGRQKQEADMKVQNELQNLSSKKDLSAKELEVKLKELSVKKAKQDSGIQDRINTVQSKQEEIQRHTESLTSNFQKDISYQEQKHNKAIAQRLGFDGKNDLGGDIGHKVQYVQNQVKEGNFQPLVEMAQAMKSSGQLHSKEADTFFNLISSMRGDIKPQLSPMVNMAMNVLPILGYASPLKFIGYIFGKSTEASLKRIAENPQTGIDLERNIASLVKSSSDKVKGYNLDKAVKGLALRGKPIKLQQNGSIN